MYANIQTAKVSSFQAKNFKMKEILKNRLSK